MSPPSAERPPRLPPTLEQVDGTRVRRGRRTLTYFGGCDYFRLATHPAVVETVCRACAKSGISVGASRLTTGNHPIYAELEAALAAFFGVEAALVLGSGFAANALVAQALRSKFDRVLLDANAHPSLQEAARILGCPRLEFQHRDVADLRLNLPKPRTAARVIMLTDGLFGRDGAIAPLGDYLAALPPTAWLLVDDAHGAFVLGARGRGAREHCGVQSVRLIQTISLSKALGVYGGAVLGTRRLVDAVIARSTMFAGQTPLPPPLAAGALGALKLLTRDTTLLERLRANTAYVKRALRRAGWPTPNNPSPIVTLVPADRSETARLRATLLAQAVFPSLIRYPGGPASGYFRFAISSEHTREQLDQLIRALTANAVDANRPAH